jgi:hypothetical protein
VAHALARRSRGASDELDDRNDVGDAFPDDLQLRTTGDHRLIVVTMVYGRLGSSKRSSWTMRSFGTRSMQVPRSCVHCRSRSW